MSDEPRIDVYDENGVLQSSQTLTPDVIRWRTAQAPDCIRWRAAQGVTIYEGETAELHLPPVEFT